MAKSLVDAACAEIDGKIEALHQAKAMIRAALGAATEEHTAKPKAQTRKRKIAFKPKPCAKCGETFTPPGARSTLCDKCRTNGSLPAVEQTNGE